MLIIAAMLALAGCSGAESDPNSVYGAQTSDTPEKAPTETGSLLGNISSTDTPQKEIQKLDPAADPPRSQNNNFGDCSRMFPGGIPPRITSKEYADVIKPKYKELCYRAFSLGHSGRTRTALWAAEVLTKSTVEMAEGISRVDEFKEDENLPEDHRSLLTDYRRSGYDRGHLSPSANMPTRAAQEESFLLSNMVPQNGKMNGGVWRDLESNVRKEAKKRKVYIVSGPLFQNATKTLKKRVLVPTAMYKAMFSVGKGAVVFVVSNDNESKTQTLSVDQFTAIYGLDPFPGLTGPVKSHNIALTPLPNAGITPEKSDISAGNTVSQETAKRDCYKNRMAKADGTYSWFTEEQFVENYKRSPRPEEWQNCEGK